MYTEKMKVACLHYNSLLLEEMMGLRKEEGGTKVAVKGRMSLAVKRRMSPAMHEWRQDILEETVRVVQKKKEEERVEKQLRALGAPSATVLQALLREEEGGDEREEEAEERGEEGEGAETEKITVAVRGEEEKSEDEGGETDEEEIQMILNRFGFEEEWETDSEYLSSHLENSSDNFTEESGREEEWTKYLVYNAVDRGRGRGRGSRGGVTRGGGGKKETGEAEEKTVEKSERGRGRGGRTVKRRQKRKREESEYESDTD